MKTIVKLFSLFAFLSASTVSCVKDTTGCSPRSASSEQPDILNFITANSINAVNHSSGMYYEVIQPGSGAVANNSSIVTVKYVGRLLNGTVFDQSANPVSFQLAGLIQGWRVGIPLIQKGGKIRLIVPSSMAYGCQDYGPIPANSILDFDIELIDVQ
ncbi:MAG TPA: FKBP-type peptidyl-prolyl cis-trans isomerase [Chitinophagaceae bacterium]|nr:FKBP-type peptidyl-prolyl cis-trans isomerase [Chitinophagaceae bacterium]HPG11994.1 FKBP-type peptidyl-prolyl cis-trans isomerase [Chitinophagaceae bacterium]HRX92848.1 FKBP-type peptidyl-prolyl cis-trans isomerase [Chitinophagaceae bacterium]